MPHRPRPVLGQHRHSWRVALRELDPRQTPRSRKGRRAAGDLRRRRAANHRRPGTLRSRGASLRGEQFSQHLVHRGRATQVCRRTSSGVVSSTRGSALPRLTWTVACPYKRDVFQACQRRAATGRGCCFSEADPVAKSKGVDRKRGSPFYAVERRRPTNMRSRSSEADLPTQQARAQAPAWLPGAHGNGRWPQGHRSTASAGPQAAVRLSDDAGFARTPSGRT